MVVTFFFRLACSVVLWGGRNTANKYHWRVFTVIQPHWVCPLSRHVCFPCSDSRLLCWKLSASGPGLHALPRSKPLRFRFSGTLQRHRLTWGCVLHSSGDHFLGAHSHPQFKSATYPFPRPSSVFWVYNGQALCLFWEADLWLRPSPWMSTVQNPKRSWLATKTGCSLVQDASLGPRLPSYGSGCPRLPVSSRGWPVHSWLVLLSPLFCERAWRWLGLFVGSQDSYPTVWVAISS